MKFISIIFTLFFLSLTALYAETIETHNVHIMHTPTSGQCPSSWNGTAQPETNITATGLGQSNALVTTSVQSCVGCAFDGNSRDCVCRSCYAYTN